MLTFRVLDEEGVEAEGLRDQLDALRESNEPRLHAGFGASGEGRDKENAIDISDDEEANESPPHKHENQQATSSCATGEKRPIADFERSDPAPQSDHANATSSTEPPIKRACSYHSDKPEDYGVVAADPRRAGRSPPASDATQPHLHGSLINRTNSEPEPNEDDDWPSTITARIKKLPEESREKIDGSEFHVCEAPKCDNVLRLKRWTEFGPANEPLCTTCSEARLKYVNAPPPIILRFHSWVQEESQQKAMRHLEGFPQNNNPDAPIDDPTALDQWATWIKGHAQPELDSDFNQLGDAQVSGPSPCC